ncbi:Ig-like domain-containing protein [Paenibacillus sp. JDR-2]|uniref:Ig-like domain-containing protein n=1 Tax=Paenibacillus sp. (strain JDR-2) TaxID=324057 RepID=UPI0001664344|nr:Ig-like domain-containing protein [Paenibacillus sp. JDR-2]ACT01513.1 S-layer domain protein [Paenibacillus sp. JDR-2]
MTLVRKLLIAWLLLALAIPAFAANAESLSTKEKFEVLKEKGIFKGLGDGSAGLNQSMTREQFAAVLYRLWGLPDNNPAKASFDDVLKSRWSYHEVEAVNQVGLMTGTAARRFSPVANVTVEQLAVVLVRAFGYGSGSSPVTGSVSAWARSSVSAALDHGFISFQSNYKAAATRGQLVDAAYVVYQQQIQQRLQVNAVRPLANSIIQVTLKEAVTKVDLSSFSLKDDQGTVIAIRTATLSSDGKTVTVSTGPQQGGIIYTLTVNGTGWRYSAIWDNNGGTVGTGDTTRPTITKIESLGYRTIRLTFSEQVSRSTAEDPDHYDIVTGDLDLYSFALSDDRRTVTITTSMQEDGYRYRLSVTGVKDLSDNTMTSRNDLYFYGIYDLDGSKPTVVSVAGQNNSTIQIVFSEKVDASDVRNVKNYIINNDLYVTRATLASDGKTVTLYTNEQENGKEYKLTINNIADLAGNVMNTRRDIVFKGINDHDKPYVQSVSVLSNSTVEVQFSEQVNADQAKEVSNYAINNNLRVTNIILDSDGDTVILTTTKQTDAVLYTLTIQGISDLAGNVMDKATNLYFGGLVDHGLPTVVGIQAAARQVVLMFSERLDASTATRVGNYKLDGNLGAVKSAVYDDAKKMVTLTTNAQTPGGVYSVTISQVNDLSGNAIATDTRIQFVGSDRETNGSIELQKLEIVNQNTAQATFSRALSDSEVASLGLTILKDNNRNVDASGWSEYVVRKSGTNNVVVIQLRTKQSGNPSLFVAGHVYTGRISDLPGLLTKDGADQKVFPGTEKINDDPYVTQVSALNSRAIKVTFSEPVRNVSASGFYLLRDDGSTIGVVGDSLNDANSIVTEITLYLDDDAKSGKTYRLRFKDSIKDAAGWNAIRTQEGSNPYQVVFAGTSTSNQAPTVTKIVSTDRYTFEMRFSEPVRFDDAGGFSLYAVSGGNKVDIQSSGNASYVLSPDRMAITVYLNADRLDPLKPNQSYRLEYDSNHGRIVDDQGASLKDSDNSGVYIFTASSAANAIPYITKVDAQGTAIKITFSEPIKGYKDETNFFNIVVDGKQIKPTEGRLDGLTIVLKVPSLASGKIGTIAYTSKGADSIRDYNSLSTDPDAVFIFGVQ